MIINTCFKITTPSYYQIYLIFPIAFTPLTLPISCFLIFGIKGYNVIALMQLGVYSLRASRDDLSQAEISLSKQFSLKKLEEPPSNLGTLCDPLSISPSKNSGSNLSIKLFKVFLYLLKIAIISEFLFPRPTACLITHFLMIITI